MRTLKFIVNDRLIRPDPSCDFTGLIPGTVDLQAEFIFSKEWKGVVKVASFWSSMGTEYPPQILEDGRTCIIPAEALKRRAFKVQVLGKKPDSTLLITNKVVVNQNGGNI